MQLEMQTAREKMSKYCVSDFPFVKYIGME